MLERLERLMLFDPTQSSGDFRLQEMSVPVITFLTVTDLSVGYPEKELAKTSHSFCGEVNVWV
jgi:hypothetical protein